MSAIVVTEMLVPSTSLNSWVLKREWHGKDDAVSSWIPVTDLTRSEAEAWHEVRRLDLRVKADEACLNSWVGSEVMQ
jgi:hypothetical protein